MTVSKVVALPRGGDSAQRETSVKQGSVAPVSVDEDLEDDEVSVEDDDEEAAIEAL